MLYAVTRPGLQYCNKFMCLHFKVKLLRFKNIAENTEVHEIRLGIIGETQCIYLF